MTDDKRDKNGRFVKGSKANQGRIPSDEQRRKQSEKMSGRVETDEHKEKIRQGMLASDKKIGRPKGGTPWNKGMKRINGDPIPTYLYPPRSEESKKHQSKIKQGKHYSPKTEFKKGLVPWNKGKEWPPEMIERMSAVHKDITDETRAKMSKAKTGIQHSAETIKKMLTRRTPTSLEMKFLDIVEKNGLPYKFVGDGSFMIERKNPDFININGEKIAIEVYARYYKLRHAGTVQEWKDEREKIFSKYGWNVIFFDETEVTEKNVLRRVGVV